MLGASNSSIIARYVLFTGDELSAVSRQSQSLEILARFALIMVYLAQVVSTSDVTQLHNAVPVELAAASVSGFTDTPIIAGLIFLLLKSHSSISGTDPIVRRLVTYTVGSGLITG